MMTNLLVRLKKIPEIFNSHKVSKKISNLDENYENLTEDEFQSLMADPVDHTTITVEVVYVTSDKQVVLETQVPRGANIEDGLVLSGLLEQCDDVELSNNKVGLFGVIKPLTEILSDGDRIEVYRPVTAEE